MLSDNTGTPIIKGTSLPTVKTVTELKAANGVHPLFGIIIVYLHTNFYRADIEMKVHEIDTPDQNSSTRQAIILQDKSGDKVVITLWSPYFINAAHVGQDMLFQSMRYRGQYVNNSYQTVVVPATAPRRSGKIAAVVTSGTQE